MLDFKRVLKSAVAPKREALLPLATPWGAALDPGSVLPEHPRPTMARRAYAMLNGCWDYAIVPVYAGEKPQTTPAALDANEALRAVAAGPVPSAFEGHILVPFSPEAPLSGVGRAVTPDDLLWYRRCIELPARNDDERVLLHLEAVDWTCAVFVDGKAAGTHQGGYLPFDLDITDVLPTHAREVELALCVYDPSDAGTQPRGKQSLNPGGIWYTAQSGIWQSVWLETVPVAYISELSLCGAADGTLTIEARVADPANSLAEAASLELVLRSASDGGEVLRESFPLEGDASAPLRSLAAQTALPHPHRWSPDDPHLYGAAVTLHRKHGSPCDSSDNVEPDVIDTVDIVDTVHSYCAFRTVEVKPDAQGTPRFFLNGEPLFLRGVLDQGYWPDGLMTAPSDAALIHDITCMRAAGFNMLRKHIKVESARWYWHCDRLGMLVWQDAVSGGSPYSPWHTSRKPTLFQASWGNFRDDTPRHRAALSADDPVYRRAWRESCLEMVRRLKRHPSIVTWVLFNEGWGQFDARAAVAAVRAADSTRPIDAVSGWYDQRCGDYLSVHNYFRPLFAKRDRAGRASVISEFGGLSQLVKDHAAVARAYGYGDFPTLDDWRIAVRKLLAQADALEAQGLAGYVYTQVSDVEDEVNGLLTYDRRLRKLA